MRRLADAVRSAIVDHIEPRPFTLRELPDLEDIHTFHDDEIALWLIHLSDQPGEWVSAAWEDGPLPLLVLRLLELDIMTRLGLTKAKTFMPITVETATEYGFEQ